MTGFKVYLLIERNGYRCKNSNLFAEFKSRTRPFTFQFTLMHLGKTKIHLFFRLQLVNSRTERGFSLLKATNRCKGGLWIQTSFTPLIHCPCVKFYPLQRGWVSRYISSLTPWCFPLEKAFELRVSFHIVTLEREFLLLDMLLCCFHLRQKV